MSDSQEYRQKPYIVQVVYFNTKTPDRVQAALFDELDEANRYCETINDLDLREGSGVYAKVVKPYESIPLDPSCLKLVFDDIVMLDDRAIQKVLREIDALDLTKALKGAAQETQDKIFRNLTKRAAAMLKEDIEYMGPTRVKDIKDARQKIMDIVRSLERNGEIVIARGGEDELVV